MGKRAILAAVLFWLLVAVAQIWLLSAILSRPLPSGKTGWEVIKDAAHKDHGKESGVAIIEILGITYKCGSAILPSPGVQATIHIRINSPSPGAPPDDQALHAGVDFSWDGLPIDTPPSYPYDYDLNISYDEGMETTPVQWWVSNYYGTEIVETGTAPWQMVVDTTTRPSFIGYSCGPDTCEPLTFEASTTVSRGDSWSFRLLDSDGVTPLAGGTAVTPTTITTCQAKATVGDIPYTATFIEFTATNGNGSTTEVFPLGWPAGNVTIEAVPTGITEGQDVTLNWTASGVWSVSIDNGVGTVWTGTLDQTASGSVTVSPTETTTYTITGTQYCDQTVTDSVEVSVLGVPRVQSAMIRLIAQEGLASAKTAKLDQSAKIRLIANDLDRRTHRKVAGHRFNIQPAETRTPHEKVAGHRFNVRAERRKVSGHRFDVRATRTKVAGHRFRVLYPDRMHVYARNTATGAVLDLGAIEMDAAELTLTDVAIPDGDWQFWTERESTFWKSNRSRDSQIVRLASGVPPAVDPLPAVINLAASVSRAVTTLTWDVSHPIPEWGLDFGLWFSETSPVATFVTPTALVEASKMRTSYSAIRRQNGAEYVAVALIGADGSLGTAAEIELPWVVIAPQSPPNQTTGG